MNISKCSLSEILKSKPAESLKNFNLSGKTALINAQVYSSGKRFVNKTLFLNNGIIVSKDVFQKDLRSTSDFKTFDLENNYLTPALVDQHIHGGYGIDFNNADENEIRNFLKELKKWGHGDILATLVPDTIEKLNKQIALIKKIIDNPKKGETKISGTNLEGPFFSPQKAGIHPPKILLEPTVDNLKKLDLDSVKMITIAPELDKEYKATEYLNSLGIITSAGHSAASAKQVRDSGVKQITHLFNAMSGFHHRIPTIANEGLLNDNLSVEVNTAIELLDPNTLNLIMRSKPKDKIILISDALSGTNIKGNYFIMGGKRIDIDENGIAKDKDGILAGSIKLMGQVAKRLVETTQMSFADFIKFASINPAKNIGVDKNYALRVGMKPNFTIWNKNTLLPEITIIKGE